MYPGGLPGTEWRTGVVPHWGSCPKVGANGPHRVHVGPARLTTIALSRFRMAKKIATPSPSAPPPESYEEALAELERLVADMEGGQMPLDRLVEGYRRGAELLGFCRGRLDAVEEQVKVLEEGQLKPWIAG